MKNLITVIIIINSFGLKLSAQKITTDRPDQTESSTTVPGRSIQIESGIVRESDGIKVNYLIPTSLLRYGLTSYLELRMTNQIVSVTEENLSTKSGISDPELGIKIQILKSENINAEIAFVSHLILPFGSCFLSNRKAAFVNRIAVSHAITSFLGLGYNVGYNYFGSGNGDLTYSLALGFGLSDKLGLYMETYGEYSDFTEWIPNLDTGFTYLVKDNFQLDISFGTGLNETMNYISAGFSWNISKKNNP